MKKSKKQRKMEIEKAKQREAAMAKAGRPYSRKKIHVCNHCEVVIWYFSDMENCKNNYLVPISETKCVCTGCRKEYSMEDYKAVEDWADNRLNNPVGLPLLESPVAVPYPVKIPQPVLKPVSYYYTDPNTIEYVNESEKESEIGAENSDGI